jgi:hypothetical protein
LVIPVSDVTAGVERIYDIQGDNTGHGHTVTVTPDDFTALDAGTVLTLESSDTGAAGQDHTHPKLQPPNLSVRPSPVPQGDRQG